MAGRFQAPRPPEQTRIWQESESEAVTNQAGENEAGSAGRQQNGAAGCRRVLAGRQAGGRQDEAAASSRTQQYRKGSVEKEQAENLIYI